MKKWIIAGLSIILFIVSMMLGYLINSIIDFSKKKEETPPVLAEEKVEEEVVDTSYSDVTVSPNAEVILTENFTRCGHTSVTREIAPREIVNLNQEKVQEYYEGCSIDSFTTDKIEVSRSTTGICDEHYVLRESDGFISINCKNDIGEYIFKGLTDISVQYLPEEDLSKLQKGIEIVGRENLNKFLEDYE